MCDEWMSSFVRGGLDLFILASLGVQLRKGPPCVKLEDFSLLGDIPLGEGADLCVHRFLQQRGVVR